MTRTPRAKFSPRPPAPLRASGPSAQAPGPGPTAWLCGGAAPAQSQLSTHPLAAAAPGCGEEEARCTNSRACPPTPFLWVCLPLCPQPTLTLFCVLPAPRVPMSASPGPTCPRVSLGPGWAFLSGPPHSPLLLPRSCPTVLFMPPWPVTGTVSPLTVFPSGGRPAWSPLPVSHAATPAPAPHPHMVHTQLRDFCCQ